VAMVRSLATEALLFWFPQVVRWQTLAGVDKGPHRGGWAHKTGVRVGQSQGKQMCCNRCTQHSAMHKGHVRHQRSRVSRSAWQKQGQNNKEGNSTAATAAQQHQYNSDSTTATAQGALGKEHILQGPLLVSPRAAMDHRQDVEVTGQA
jgi:hypothetical protein